VPYTLAKFFFWGLLMALAGGVIGWLLRSLTCRAEVARAKAITVDNDELDRLRGRLANLEPVVAERDRLRMELADVRGSSAGALGFATTANTSIILDELVVDDDAPEAMPALFADVMSTELPASGAVDGPAAVAPEARFELDPAEASAALGKKVRLDDLTVVEGIGPKITELCNAIGITTWAELASADVETLQSMLTDAGSRFQMHKPGSWPGQARLLAAGQWADFQQLTADLADGT
jgi:predicted flap endonuclease-1-like 5' DNA nuclease